MSHFYGDLQGNRGCATRCGSRDSGIDGHIRGWQSGAKVICHVDNEGRDVVSVYATCGSGYRSDDVVTGLIFRTVDGKLDFLAKKKYIQPPKRRRR